MSNKLDYIVRAMGICGAIYLGLYFSVWVYNAYTLYRDRKEREAFINHMCENLDKIVETLDKI